MLRSNKLTPRIFMFSYETRSDMLYLSFIKDNERETNIVVMQIIHLELNGKNLFCFRRTPYFTF